MQAFAKVIELKGFGKAASALELSTSSVSRLIAGLEGLHGVQLFIRSSRSLSPTDSAYRFYEQISPILEQLREVSYAAGLSAVGSREGLRGSLNLSVPTSVGNLLIAMQVPSLLDLHPGLSSVSLVCTDRVMDLFSESIDAAIRVGIKQDGRLVSRPLGQMVQHFAASPDFLARHGTPKTIEELMALPFVAYGASAVEGPETVHAVHINGEVKSWKARWRARCNDGATYTTLAMAGLGVIQAFPYDLMSQVKNNTLQVLLPEWSSPSSTFSLVYLPRSRVSRRLNDLHAWLHDVFATQSVSYESLRS